MDAGPADLASGEMRLLNTAEGDVLVANVAGSLYAVSGTCPHEGWGLADGILYDFDRSIVCSLHGSRFDLSSGAVIDPPAASPLRTYAVSVEAGRLVVELPGARP